jgi:signal transduction histidine kinase
MAFWSRWSIAVKLPLAFAVVLLILGGTMAVVSYLEVRQAVIGIASDRLHQAATQMAAQLGTSARQRVAAMQQLMQRREVVAYLRSRDAADAEDVRVVARDYLGPAIAIAGVELWDPAGARLLATGASFDAPSGAAADDYRRELQDGTPVIGRLRNENGALVYAVGGRLIVDGQPLGYVVERRRASNPSQTEQTLELLAGLIGDQASIIVGNRDGGTWTDLSGAVTGVPIVSADAGRMIEYARPGTPRLFAWALPIDATPWIVAVEFPREAILRPADRLIRRASAIAALLLSLAALAGWAFSRRITTPLRRVTAAAEALADSRHAPHIDIDRFDEIGRLAESFNTMAENVERARAELERRVEQRTAELTAANLELESFSYSVSHDLRAPLRAIAGFVQILEEDHAAAFDDDARKAFERIKVNARRMGDLIDDLLEFSRIARAPLARERVDMTALARAAADEAVAMAGRPVEVTLGLLPPAHAEPALVAQVYANLLSNAVKFTSRRPEPRITIGASTGGNGTVYFVRDNGAGFDPEYAHKLFGVFQRLHRSSEFEGTGVGLAIVQRIVLRHGGRVWAEGAVDQGATFYFTIGGAPPVT